MNYLFSLLVLPLICLFSHPFAAQSTQGPAKGMTVSERNNGPATFEYSDISLSDPAIYSDEPFSISLKVRNTSDKDAKHEVRLLIKDATAAKGMRKQASKFLALSAGQSETITFTFKAADLVEALDNMPDIFVFLLGEYEIGVGYEK